MSDQFRALCIKGFRVYAKVMQPILDDENQKKIKTKGREKAKDITSDVMEFKILNRKLKTNQYTQCMELAKKKRDSMFRVKGNGFTRKCDQVKEEMKTIEQDIGALEAKEKKLLEKYRLKFSFVLPSFFEIEVQIISLVSLLGYLCAYSLLVVNLFLFCY